MRETRADTSRAVVQAVLLHALLVGAFLLGMWWTRSAAPAGAPGAMSADVVDASALSSSMQRALRAEPVALPEPTPAPLPTPEPAVEPPQPEAQEQLPVPDTETQEAVVETPTPTPAEVLKPQEQKQEQKQVDLTPQEKQKAPQQTQRLAEQQAIDRRIEEIRRQRAAATREAKLAEQKLQQLADARAGKASEEAAKADAQAGSGGTDTGLQARYAAALTAAIQAKWTRPDSIQPGELCRLVIRQLPGGEVVSAEVSSPCSYDEQGRRSIEAAVLKAQPLPYAGFESVFNRNLTLNFRAGN